MQRQFWFDSESVENNKRTTYIFTHGALQQTGSDINLCQVHLKKANAKPHETANLK